MSIVVNGTRAKNVVFNGKEVLSIKNKRYIIFNKAGKKWTQSNITNSSFGGGARYANGLWVACGSDAYWSEDGKTWEGARANTSRTDFGGGARYANELWVACGSNSNGLYYSEEI